MLKPYAGVMVVCGSAKTCNQLRTLTDPGEWNRDTAGFGKEALGITVGHKRQFVYLFPETAEQQPLIASPATNAPHLVALGTYLYLTDPRLLRGCVSHTNDDHPLT